MPDYGDYGFAVLASYLVSIVLLASLVALSISRQRKIRAQIRALEKDTE